MFRLEEIEGIVEKSILNLEFKNEPQSLYAPLEYIISIGGKRIRPKLCLVAFGLFSTNMTKQIIYPALALEIFHNFTLIHDDIMDKSDLRRNQPTVHKKWGDNCAILSGDVMSIISYKYLAAYTGEKLPQVLDLFTTTASQVCEGQQYDMDYEQLPFITGEDYIHMIGLKTAVLLACSAKMGAIIGGADDNLANAIYNYGYKLGIAFQIADDYLDTFGDTQVFGKKIGGDIINNKKTWLLVECFRKATDESRGKLQQYLSMPETQEEEKIALMKQLYIDLGVKDGAVAAINDYHKQAMDAITGVGFTKEQTEQLRAFSETIINRNK